jgi:hypothetical protein
MLPPHEPSSLLASAVLVLVRGGLVLASGRGGRTLGAVVGSAFGIIGRQPYSPLLYSTTANGLPVALTNGEVARLTAKVVPSAVASGLS